MINFKLKKFLSILGILLLVGPNFFLWPPQKAEAGHPVTVVGETSPSAITRTVKSIATSIATHATAISSAATAESTLSLQIKEYVLDPIAWVVAKTILRMLTNSIVNWIKSGFHGNPLFITNLKQTALEAAEEASGLYLNELQGKNPELYDFICGPFKIPVLLRLQLARYYYLYQKPYFHCSYKSLFSKPEEIASFMKDFRNGGWQTWLQITREPTDTPFGAYLAASDQLALIIGAAKHQAETEAKMNAGFLSIKKCVKWEYLHAPGRTAEENRYCAQWESTTPGKIIQEQLGGALQVGGRSLEYADEIDEIISALIEQLFSMLMNAGENGISGYTPPKEETLPQIPKIGKNLSEQIAKDIDSETNYKNYEETILQNLKSTKEIYIQANSCYKNYINYLEERCLQEETSYEINRVKTKISANLAKIQGLDIDINQTEKEVNQASTTIKQLQELSQKIKQSNNQTNYSESASISRITNSQKTYKQYTDLHRLIHTPLDISSAKEQKENTQKELDKAPSASGLNECQNKKLTCPISSSFSM